MQTMVEFDFLCVLYVDGIDQKVSISRVNYNLPEYSTVMTLFKISQVDEIYSLKNLIYLSARLFISVSDPAKPNSYYSSTNYVVEINLNSTAGVVLETFNSRFPGSGKPIVILKLYYVTRQI